MSENKPREWTIVANGRGLAGWSVVVSSAGLEQDFDGIHPKFVHVVERSVYLAEQEKTQKLESELAQAMSLLREKDKTIIKLKEELAEWKERHEIVTSTNKLSRLTIETLRENKNKLQQAYDVLKNAVEFYGNEMSYSTSDYRGVSGEMIYRCILYGDTTERNDVYSYAGKKAREALVKADKIMG